MRTVEWFEALEPSLGIFPLAVALFCFIGAYISNRRKQPYVYRLISGVLIVVLTSALPESILTMTGVFGLMLGGCLCDTMSSPKTPALVKPILMALGVLVLLMLGKLNIPPERITLSPSVLLVKHRGVTTVERERIRILEIGEIGEREWQIKDGQNIVSFREYQGYHDSAKLTVYASEVIDRIEKWAGVKRELYYRFTDGSFVKRPEL
jgi:hypothetical protein